MILHLHKLDNGSWFRQQRSVGANGIASFLNNFILSRIVPVHAACVGVGVCRERRAKQPRGATRCQPYLDIMLDNENFEIARWGRITSCSFGCTTVAAEVKHAACSTHYNSSFKIIQNILTKIGLSTVAKGNRLKISKCIDYANMIVVIL